MAEEPNELTPATPVPQPDPSPFPPYAASMKTAASQPAAVAAPATPRVWTVFAVYVLAFGALMGGQVALAVGVLLWMMRHGMDVQQAASRLIEMAATPEFFIAMGTPAQATLLATALVAGWCSSQPLVRRLGLNWPHASLKLNFIWLTGTLVPFGLGMGAAQLLAEVISPDPSVAKLYEHMHWGIAPAFILFIALAPGLSEEVLFRGYIQRRLTARWPASIGILVTSLMFSVMHLMPHTVMFAFVVGIWFGIMAWRNDSIWPSALGHALVNGLWNIWQVGKSLDAFPEEFPLPLLIVVGLLGLASFVVACWT